ncbi:MAG: hypothetical protein OH338_01605 [Candidatus Parvarchaeota archaeon]|nr:hypothetical protein [Candidatus Parvarchaeota archaeon]MCW1294448.1 hypothetical protein [Candidatus Parvarchaeum tengchongense]MCW1295153.1 hypothetical protein [Candidatus Parvarchaeum tengchongense]MCW1299022.1 hypothetical protein [Candidatus Parvarchaeum tengchongense]MCW1312110.1 hypothetical protein [Candidatus Parvarchaeum tengchongense]
MYLSRLVIDAVKPIGEYSIIDLANDIAKHVRNGDVFIKVVEVDIHTEGLKVVIEGSKINFEGIQKALKDRGAVINSLDEATVSSNGKSKK